MSTDKALIPRNTRVPLDEDRFFDRVLLFPSILLPTVATTETKRCLLVSFDIDETTVVVNRNEVVSLDRAFSCSDHHPEEG